MDEKSARLVKTVLEAIQQDPELVRLSQAVEEAFRQATTGWAVPDAAKVGLVRGEPRNRTDRDGYEHEAIAKTGPSPGKLATQHSEQRQA